MHLFAYLFRWIFVQQVFGVVAGDCVKLCLKVFPFSLVFFVYFHLKKKNLTSVLVSIFFYSVLFLQQVARAHNLARALFTESLSDLSQTAALKLLSTAEINFSYARSSISKLRRYSIQSRD
jgi:hypothetical protein